MVVWHRFNVLYHVLTTVCSDIKRMNLIITTTPFLFCAVAKQ